MIKRKKHISFISIFILVVMLLSTYPIASSANETNNSDGVELEDESIYDFCSNNKVIVSLKNTALVNSTELYSIYSDDYSTINNNAGTILAASTSEIEEVLNLGIDISKMELLNPSISSSIYGTYEFGEENNNIFSVEFENNSLGEVLDTLNSNPNINYAEPNYYYHTFETPNDLDYELQYALSHINAEDAWENVTGNNNVVVGIIDSGIDGHHIDLRDNIWNNPFYSSSGCSRCSRHDDLHGYNFTGDGHYNTPVGGIPTDSISHGTHVSGIVGAVGNNNEGVCGVNWNVSLAWLGVSGGGNSISLDGVIEALNYANNHNIFITNNSYGGPMYSMALKDAIDNYNGLFIAAAGNDGCNNDIRHQYPACYDCENIISVASTDENDNLSNFSNYGNSTVDVAAPGSNIYSTISGSTYDYMNGTSMATPFVTGIAALIKAKNPSFSIYQIKAAICDTVQNLNKTYGILYDGGIVDAEAATSITTSDLKRIKFNYNYPGATEEIIKYVVYGKSIKKPDVIPQRNGYIFSGWYTSSTIGGLYNFNTAVTDNRTLYAHWTTAPAGSYAEVFPDYSFRNRVLYLLNRNDNGSRNELTIISQEDYDTMSEMNSLDISNLNIIDTSGLEYFCELSELICNNNLISSLDLSNFHSLKIIDCRNNRITNLNLSGLTQLETIYCSNNILNSISIYSSGIKEIDCRGNNISSLDTSTLYHLEILLCSYNNLSNLNISNCYRLTNVYCSNNNISCLNVANLNNLECLVCDNNSISSLTTGASLTALDCSNNNISKLSVNNSPNIQYIDCSNNSLLILDLCDFDTLYYLNISHNDLNNDNDILQNYNKFRMITEKIYFPQNEWENCPFNDSLMEGCRKAIEYVYSKNYMLGTTSTTFSPNNVVTRAQAAVIFYAMAGKPNVSSYTIPFNDVPTNSYYYNAVKWAYHNSIMSGTSNTTFSPNNSITNEMLTLVVKKYSLFKNDSLNEIRPTFTYADESNISSWAINHVKEMYKKGIIDYFDDDGEDLYFLPSHQVTRKEIATIIRRYEAIKSNA